MTSVLHPNQQSFKKRGHQAHITTYDYVSTSPSKMKHSFSSNAPRFVQHQKNSSKDLIYTLPSTSTKKACGFGIGERFASYGRLKQSK